jgi:hypothetical protein
MPQKYFAFAFTEYDVSFPHSAPARGAYASSRTWSGMRWTRRCLLTSGRGGGRRSCVVLSPRRWRHVGDDANASRRQRWQTSIGSPRRAPISRKPLRGEGRLSPPVPVVNALAQISFARGPRVQRPPGLPRTLVVSRAQNDARLGCDAPRECDFMRPLLVQSKWPDDKHAAPRDVYVDVTTGFFP